MQRHTRRRPCPVCGGHSGLKRGIGQRCHGYTTQSYVYCSREEYAGTVEVGPTGLYQHFIRGECPCGNTHDGLWMGA